jgi:hypothetical protein
MILALLIPLALSVAPASAGAKSKGQAERAGGLAV